MVHQYKNNGYNIMLDVNSGMVHIVDDLAYDIIGMYEHDSQDNIIAAMVEKYTRPEYMKLIVSDDKSDDFIDYVETLLKQILEVMSDVEQLKQDGSLYSRF